MISGQTGKGSAAVGSNIKQNPKSQSVPTATGRFGQVAKGKQAGNGNTPQANFSQSRLSTFGNMNMTPNFRKPPIPNPVKPAMQAEASETRQGASNGLPVEPERNEQNNE